MELELGVDNLISETDVVDGIVAAEVEPREVIGGSEVEGLEAESMDEVEDEVFDMNEEPFSNQNDDNNDDLNNSVSSDDSFAETDTRGRRILPSRNPPIYEVLSSSSTAPSRSLRSRQNSSTSN